jgi:hypothetical protein
VTSPPRAMSSSCVDKVVVEQLRMGEAEERYVYQAPFTKSPYATNLKFTGTGGEISQRLQFAGKSPKE